MSAPLDYQYITTAEQLREFCDVLTQVETIAMDTEFVSERTYRSDLCLVQVEAEGRLALLDACVLPDMTPFWQVLADPSHETIVHAGREEFRFCTHAVGHRPGRLFDVQIAAGLVGMEYPAAYHKILSRLLGKSLPKLETRTDWRRRPLSKRQIEYALHDVIYLHEVRNLLHEQLGGLGRLEWLAAEMEAWQQDVEKADQQQRWRRVSGIAGLGPRELAIVREMWQWRETEAERRDVPPRRVLRDDLIVVLARTSSTDVKRIGSIRGMERGDLRRRLPELAGCVERALALPDDRLPRKMKSATSTQVAVLGQFLSTALTSTCRAQQVAPSLVGTVQDVRDLVAYRLDGRRPGSGELPELAQGWRSEVVGRLIDDLLAGKLSIRITDPRSDHPLEFMPVETGHGNASKK